VTEPPDPTGAPHLTSVPGAGEGADPTAAARRAGGAQAHLTSVAGTGEGPDRAGAGRRDEVPRLIVVTDRRQADAAGHRLLDVVRAAVDAGAPAVLVREKDLPLDERRRLVDRIANLLPGEIGRRGRHLPRPGTTGELSVLVGADLTGRSCHDTGELAIAWAEGVDYATLSPVFATASKPGHGPPLGLDGLAAAVATVPDLPVVALGGITPTGPTTPAACLRAGAVGVAVMGAVMTAPDPYAVVRDLMASLGEAVRP
jgi:thiamine-phosphate pyrophosphorylase